LIDVDRSPADWRRARPSTLKKGQAGFVERSLAQPDIPPLT